MQVQFPYPELSADLIGEPQVWQAWSYAPRILYIAGDAPFFVTHFLELAGAAMAAGYEVHLAAPHDRGSGRGDEDAIRRVQRDGIIFHQIGLQRSSVNLAGEVSLVMEFHNLVRSLKPDLVHCLGIKPILYAGALARLNKLAAVHSVIGLGLPFMRKGVLAQLRRQMILAGFKFAFGNPKAEITVEHELDRSTIASAVGGRAVTRTFGVGVNLNLFRPQAPTKPHAEPVVMFGARLIETKGVRDFVEAARRLKSQGVAARFVMQCQLDLRNRHAIQVEEVESWVREGIVEWWGQTSDMASALRKADIFCLPTYYREGTPKALLEAAATGLPIVTTNLPGCGDAVIDQESGLLVPPQDVDALTNALHRLITDTEFRSAAGRRARELAVQQFGVRLYVDTVLGFYQSLSTGATKLRTTATI